MGPAPLAWPMPHALMAELQSTTLSLELLAQRARNARASTTIWNMLLYCLLCIHCVYQEQTDFLHPICVSIWLHWNTACLNMFSYGAGLRAPKCHCRHEEIVLTQAFADPPCWVPVPIGRCVHRRWSPNCKKRHLADAWLMCLWVFQSGLEHKTITIVSCMMHLRLVWMFRACDSFGDRNYWTFIQQSCGILISFDDCCQIWRM